MPKYETINSRLAKRLRFTRQDLDLKQKDVATALQKTSDFVSMTELDKRSITVEDIVEFSRLYKKPIIYFFQDL
jgi:transcriptional regulator with XRE-family HTH domain